MGHVKTLGQTCCCGSIIGVPTPITKKRDAALKTDYFAWGRERQTEDTQMQQHHRSGGALANAGKGICSVVIKAAVGEMEQY